MTPKRWQQVNEVFHSALELELEPGQRADFLSQVCAGDEVLRREIESLIRSHQQNGSFIDAPAIEVAAEVMDDDQTELTVAQAISHYKILRTLGAGGMGKVYLAEDNLLHRKVAIKLLPNALTNDPQMRARFIREAQLASALDHSNICTIHEVGESNGQHFIVMQYIEGETLKRLVGNRPLTLDALIPISLQLADALSAAHARDIVHRDIKPSNIIITSRGQAKVLDFGLAKLLEGRSGEGESGLTWTGAMLGTPSYMSPEQARGAHVDHRSDIFSLGVVIYEMATGRVAFQGKSHAETMNAVINEPHVPAAGLNQEVPAALSAVIDRSLAKEATHRYQSMDELISELRQVAQAVGMTSSSVPVIVPRRHGLIGNLWPASRLSLLQARKTKSNPTGLAEKNNHRSFFWGAGIVAAILVVAVAGSYLVRSPESRQPSLAARPLTTDPGFEGMPSLSPDGNYVAFIAGGGEQQKDYDLYVKQIGGGSPLRLTSGPAVEEFPAWSPDGRSIAFARQKGDKLDVVLIPPIGGPERKVAEIAAPDESQSIFSWQPPYLSWSADSKYLVTTDTLSSGKPPGLVVLSVATGEKRQLTQPPQAQNDGNPAVSPDGRTLAFVRVISVGRPQLYVLSLTADCRPAGVARYLDVPHPWVTSPTWTSDGREIVCSAGEPWGSGFKRLWRVPVSGSEKPQPLTSVGEDVIQPTISRQGNRLVYAHWTYDTDIWRAELSGPGRNSPAVKLIASTHIDNDAQYSPDGSKIVFCSVRSGSAEIWMCNSDGSSPVQLTSLEALSGSPRWFPDGRHIVFDSNKEGHVDISVIDTDSLVPRRLTDGPSDSARPSVSHDGKWIYFESPRTGRLEIWRMPSEGGEPTQVTHEGGMMPFESVEGKVIYYLKQTSETAFEVRKVPVSGGAETKVVGPTDEFQFAVVGEGIYIVQVGIRVFAGSRGNSLKFFSFARGTAEVVCDIKYHPDSPGLSVSPDGRYALMTLVDPEVCDLMLVENFH